MLEKLFNALVYGNKKVKRLKAYTIQELGYYKQFFQYEHTIACVFNYPRIIFSTKEEAEEYINNIKSNRLYKNSKFIIVPLHIKYEEQEDWWERLGEPIKYEVY